MKIPGEDWKLDELETIRSVLNLYHTRLEQIEEDDGLRYISRDEYARFSKSMVHCLEISMQQMERMLGCIDQLVEALSGLTDEVVELKSRADRLEEHL